ncbi:unnamed protein product [Coffea canephora]|uniref:DRBM domain-containing protein n=1 Tax=Coffea canephora TaxID=49390 RepID=A0A068TQZ1_COFCA|nr:unnamed protein product [Coffea canephora]
MANKFPSYSVFTSRVQEPKPEDHLGLPLEPSKPEHDYGVYKNLLQEYAQKSGLPLPLYNIENEGFPHAPKFRSSVIIDETKFTSKFTFPDRRAAEQDVAKLAYEAIVKDNKTLTGGPHIYQNLRFCKLIVYEYATKTGLGVPEYNTTLAEGPPRPVFVSSFVLGGKSYTGQVGRSKKEAEQLVARLAIQSLLETASQGSDSGKLTEIIKSKERLFATLSAKKNSENQGTKTLSVHQSSNAGNLSQQQASIQTGIISYNPGSCTVTCAKGWTKRKVENNWEQKKKKGRVGAAIKRPGYNFRP